MSLFTFGDLSVSDIERYICSPERLSDGPVVIHIAHDEEDATDAEITGAGTTGGLDAETAPTSDVTSTSSIAAKQEET
jgi:hypothetical protein